ncbi:MAG: flagellar biosynthesis anti-sigma factor FlgM [bacterium]|nr:flagellar biosynthesis anti-sigma factor FlgM [bacterium]
MKISSSGHIPGDEHVKPKTGAKAGEAREAPGPSGRTDQKTGSDQIEISGVVQEISRISELVRATPDIRSDRVDAVKAAIDSGSYQINGRKVAEKLLNTIHEEQPE